MVRPPPWLSVHCFFFDPEALPEPDDPSAGGLVDFEVSDPALPLGALDVLSESLEPLGDGVAASLSALASFL